MKVKQVCSRTVRCCTPDTKLSDAGWAMWEGDCGFLPVVDEVGKVAGVITDRDICMSTSTKYRPAAEITVREAMATNVLTCRLDDEIGTALKTIRRSKVRRLPVLDAKGKVQGILSLNDIALAAKSEPSAGLSDVTYEDLALAMKAVCWRPAGGKGSPLAEEKPASTEAGVKE